jgi:hypothetical protein
MKNKEIKELFKNSNLKVEIDCTKYFCNFSSYNASDAVRREELEARIGYNDKRKRLYLKDEDCKTLTFAKAKIVKITNKNNESKIFWLYQKDKREHYTKEIDSILKNRKFNN